MHTHCYQQPNLPHSYGSPETTQTPHFHNHSARLNRKQENKKNWPVATTPQRACLTHHTHSVCLRCLFSHTTCTRAGNKSCFSFFTHHKQCKYWTVKWFPKILFSPKCRPQEAERERHNACSNSKISVLEVGFKCPIKKTFKSIIVIMDVDAISSFLLHNSLEGFMCNATSQHPWSRIIT